MIALKKCLESVVVMLFDARKKAFASRARDLVSMAGIVSLSIDEAVTTIAATHRVSYPALDPWCLYTYVLAGVGTALMTSTHSKAGKPPFDVLGESGLRSAVNAGWEGLRRSPVTRRWESQWMDFQHLDRGVSNYLAFQNRENLDPRQPAANVGTWIWLNIRERVSPPHADELVAAVIGTSGQLTLSAFGPYWVLS